MSVQKDRKKGCTKGVKSSRLLSLPVIVDFVIWITVGMPVLILYIMGNPYENGFFCDDKSLMYPYKEDTISDVLLIAGSFGAVFVLVLLVEVMNCLNCRKKYRPPSDGRLYFCIKSYAVFFFGFVINQMYVEVIKNQAGTLRPNFFHVCKPNFQELNCSKGYVAEYKCTSTEHDAKDIINSRQSFPSGHAALAMYAATFLLLYMQKRLKLHYSHGLKLMLQVVLVLVAVMCGITRVRDNKHHASDVIAGLLLGMVVAATMFFTMGKRVLSFSSSTSESTDNLPLTKRAVGLFPEPQTPLPLLANEVYSGSCTPPVGKDRRALSMPS